MGFSILTPKPMAFLRRDQVKTHVVIASLSVIADLPNDVESAPLTPLNDMQDHIFLTTLKSKLNALPYFMNDGSTNYLAYYDVNLRPDSIDDWPTVKDCIDWIVANQRVVYLS
jgi:hypothetical protein